MNRKITDTVEYMAKKKNFNEEVFGAYAIARFVIDCFAVAEEKYGEEFKEKMRSVFDIVILE